MMLRVKEDGLLLLKDEGGKMCRVLGLKQSKVLNVHSEFRLEGGEGDQRF